MKSHSTAQTGNTPEIGCIELEGKEFCAGGSYVSPEFVIAYKKGNEVTTWAGEVIGTCRVTSTWKTPRSYVSSTMHQLELVVNGYHYTGRCAGDGMIFKGKRMKKAASYFARRS